MLDFLADIRDLTADFVFNEWECMGATGHNNRHLNHTGGFKHFSTADFYAWLHITPRLHIPPVYPK